MKKNQKYGVMLVLTGATLWGSSSNSMEYLMGTQHIAWQTVLFVRMAITALCFLGYALVRGKDLLQPLKEQPFLMLKFTVLGMYMMQATFTLAIYYSNAATGTVLQYLMPAILLAYFLLKEHRTPSRREMLAVVLAILGTTLIATKGHGAALAISDKALFWGVASALGMALYTAYASELLKSYSSLIVIGWGSLGNVLLLLFLNAPDFAGGIWDSHTLLAFSFVIVLGTLLAYSAYLESTRYIPASETGALAAVEPLSAYVISILFMGNKVGPAEMAGAACIIFMVCMLSRKK